MKTLILGPCLMESKDLYLNTGRSLSNLINDFDFYFKASFDKANRTSVSSPRGPGLAEGIQCFQEIKKEFPQIKLTTDIHEPTHAEALSDIIDVMQIPAFLSRQTDLLVAAAQNCNIVNIKKGQWLGPVQTCQAADKIRNVNPHAQVWLTERGSFFGYDRLVIDFSLVETFKSVFDQVILDCTHATQKLNGATSGGDSELAKKYFLSAPVFGYQGIFAEVHPCPPKALSDADSQIPLDEVSALISNLKRITAIINAH
ncbi:MAG: 3-deoxy-8-phosphooctulonate synthase [Deltaproteobacteria bacterium]|nr:3-deoxy-8-phosphooctulonate synthase [Deltaproteobacteria bacterium]